MEIGVQCDPPLARQPIRFQLHERLRDVQDQTFSRSALLSLLQQLSALSGEYAQKGQSKCNGPQ
jgi:hypothetical protein